MRKLAAGCLAFSAGVFLANTLPGRWTALIPAGACVLGFLVLLCLPAGKPVRAARILLIAATLGLSFFTVTKAVTEQQIARIPTAVTAHEAIVLDYAEPLENTDRVRLLVLDKELHYRAWLYDRYGNISSLRPGDRIRLEASFAHRESESAAATDSNLSKGILATGNLRSPVTVLCSGRSILFPSRVLSRFVRDSVPQIFEQRAAVFLRALLLGEKTELYKDAGIYSALLRSGFLHTVAVSGMHVSYVAGLCLLLFGSRRRGAFLSIGIIWLFVLTAGSTPSAVRAGIMQTVFLMAPVFRRENDPLTALSFALALILLFDPFSAGSISLQLSFASTLGILLFAPRIQQDLLAGVSSEKLKRLLRYPAAILASSLGVSALTIPLCGLRFGYVCILSVLTNLAALWAIPLCFCGAFLCVFLRLLSPALAVLLGKAVSLLCRFVLFVCTTVAKIPFAVVPFEGPFILILFLLCYALFVLFAFSAFRGSRRVLIPLGFSAVLIALYFTYTALSSGSVRASVRVLDVGQGECVVALAGNRSLVVDCGSSDYMVHAGETCAETLFLNGHRDLDSLVLTHLHDDHINGACALMQTLPVKNLFLPVNIDTESEDFLLLRQTAQRNSTKVYLVDTDAQITSGDLSYTLLPSLIYTEENESCMSVLLETCGKSFLITGDSPYTNEMLLLQDPALGDVDVLVAGHHGANNASCTLFLQGIRPEFAVISVGRENSYGHPSLYTLRRLQAEGCSICRTDLNGTVSFILH